MSLVLVDSELRGLEWFHSDGFGALEDGVACYRCFLSDSGSLCGFILVGSAWVQLTCRCRVPRGLYNMLYESFRRKPG